MGRLLNTAIEQEVGEGRPRDLVEAKEPFRLVAEHFMDNVRLCLKHVKEHVQNVAPRCKRSHVLGPGGVAPLKQIPLILGRLWCRRTP